MFDWLRRNQWVYVVLFVVAAAIFWRATASNDGPSNSDVISDDTWFYDVATGESFRAPRDQVPPIRSPDGNEAVWASMYGCGGCGESQRFIGYMIKHTDDLKARADANPAVRASLFGESCKGRLYSTDGKTWIAADNPQAAGMTEASQRWCQNWRRCP